VMGVKKSTDEYVENTDSSKLCTLFEKTGLSNKP